MKRIIHILPLLVCVGGIGIIVAAIREYREEQQTPVLAEKAAPQEAVIPQSDNYAEKDQRLIEETFNRPEVLDAAISENMPNEKDPVLLAKEGLIGDLSVSHIPVGTQAITNVSATIESFSSVRTDAVRNPDSSQNQKMVKNIMEKRQRRMRELGLN